MNLYKSDNNSQPTHSNQATSLSKFYWSAALACAAIISSILPAEATSVNFTHVPETTSKNVIGSLTSEVIQEDVSQMIGNFSSLWVWGWNFYEP